MKFQEPFWCLFHLGLALAFPTQATTELRCPWKILAAPKIIVPGQESVIWLQTCNTTSQDLMATLTIWDTAHHKVIHGMVWQVEDVEQTLFDSDSGNTAGQKGYTSDSEGISAKMVTAVQVRVPSSLPPSEGVLRLHSQKDCHPFTEEQIEDEKCPSNCLADLDLENSISTKCMEIPFRLASSIRQILLITDQTHYQKKETVRIRYQVLDESTQPRNPAELTITIEDASGVLIHSWNVGYLQRKDTEIKSNAGNQVNLFDEITFPLGLRSLEGKWVICAQDWPSSILFDEAKSEKYCIDFWVVSQEDQPDEEDSLEQEENEESSNVKTELLSDEQTIREGFKIQVDFHVPNTFRPGVPFGGRILSSSPEEELEVLVKLLEGKNRLLDQQTLLITENEGVFQFMPIQTQAENLTIEVYLISSNQWNGLDDGSNSNDLEIDEINPQQLDEEENNLTDLIYLDSKIITKDPERPERYHCPIWTQGLERTFKTGDFAIGNVKSNCQCNSNLYWVLERDGQFVAWGQEKSEILEDQKGCTYKVGLEITSRMAPQAIFRAWRPIFNEGEEGERNSLPHPAAPLAEYYSYDEQNVTVNLEDRTLVILELNTTEVSHSTSNVGIEVFAEPESTICLRGQKTTASSSSTSTSVSNTFGAVLLSSQATSMYQDVFKQMIQVFSPVSKTWFFQCGQASEDGFYTTWVKAPSEGGQWSVEAVSMSPFHGLRKAQSQPLLRTMPISVAIEGIPSSLKRAEILRNVTIRTRNNMPVPMQMQITVTSELIEGNEFTIVVNASAYESLKHKIQLHVPVTSDTNVLKNISAHVTSQALVDHQFVEMESYGITKDVFILPRGRKIVQSQMEYFCLTDSSQSPLVDDVGSEIKIDPIQTGVNFSINGKTEVVIFLVDDSNMDIKYKLVIGAQENSVTYLSEITKAGESRLITSSTPQILSSEEAAAVSNTHFWLSWQVDTGHVRCIRLLDTSNTGGERSIINWPIPVTFTPRRISTLAQPHVHLRFWDGQRQLRDVHKAVGQISKGGHNRIFHTSLNQQQIDANIGRTMKAQMILSSGFDLPKVLLHSEMGKKKAKKEEIEKVTFYDLLDSLRDVATWSLLERLQGFPKGQLTNDLQGQMHKLMQDLMYFRNVDGSFGEPMTQQTFEQAMELLHLFSEIETFYPLSPFLISGLENWILKSPHRSTLNVLEWAPRESKVFQTMGAKAQYDTMNSLLNLRNEIGLMGVVKLPEFTHTIAIMAEEKELDDILRYYLETIEKNILCEPENFKELIYRMWTLSKKNQVDMELFQCIYNNSHAILRNPEIGYTVVRALVSTYRTMATSNTEAASEPNMKISLALSNDLGHATTWKMKRLLENNDQESENINDDDDDMVENNGNGIIEKLNPFQDSIKLENSLFSSEKLYFLATGEGCASIELKTSEESFHVENENSIYEMALDANQDERGDLFLSMCLRIKNNGSETPTSISVDFFSGYHFVSLSNSDNTKEFWHVTNINHNLVLHVNKVSGNCGTCATLKFKQSEKIMAVAPAKLIVYPTIGSIRSHEKYEQFFLIKSNNLTDLNENQQNWLEKPDSQVISLWPLVDLCPCHFECKVNKSTDDAELENNSTNFINTTTTTTTTQILNALEKNTEESTISHKDIHFDDDDIIMKNTTIKPSEPSTTLENKLPKTTTVIDSNSNFDNATQQSISTSNTTTTEHSNNGDKKFLASTISQQPTSTEINTTAAATTTNTSVPTQNKQSRKFRENVMLKTALENAATTTITPEDNKDEDAD